MELLHLVLSTTDKTLIFDESGNMGTSGRYFVISCIETNKPKEIHNVMKKKLKQAKEKFSNLKFNGCELKANKAYPAVKHHILECLCKKDIKISYIVIDLKYAEQKLLEDNNLLYNYACKLLINRIITEDCANKALNIWFDNHTVKVHSKNSFSDYIKLVLNYHRNLNMDILVEYVDSNAGNAFVIQAADFVANAIYTKYEHGYDLFYEVIRDNLNCVEEFPFDKFGQ